MPHLILCNTVIFSIQNLGFHGTEVHRVCDNAVVTWSYVLGDWKCKESIGIFPIEHVL